MSNQAAGSSGIGLDADRGRQRDPSLLVAIATLLSAASMLVFGFWAFFGPESFIDYVNYSPYNEHLTRDAGAFQIGLGVALVIALFWRDGLGVALAGFVAASGLHTISHYIDRDVGGHDSDVPLLAVFTVIAIVAIVARLRARKTHRSA